MTAKACPMSLLWYTIGVMRAPTNAAKPLSERVQLVSLHIVAMENP
jgi:hypothetical protein